MKMSKIHYWGYRIDINYIDFFWKELEAGRLRQGWGYDDSQNLKDFSADDDAGAKRNFAIYEKVKKDDILIIPRLPEWDYVTIAKATEDFDKGYRFEISDENGDYGHIFPAQFIKCFSRTNEHVDADIRTTLRNPSRFWNIDYLEESINKLINCTETIESPALVEDKMDNYISEIFNNAHLENLLFDKFNEKFEAAEWENVLVEGLKYLYPYYSIEHTGGASEAQHGTDILVKIPGISPELSYAIAIQVKDYDNIVGTYPLEQLSKADYWNKDASLKLIDKILIVTKAPNDKNVELMKAAEAMGITVFMANEVKELIYKMALKRAAKGIR
jgi:hypothetical protein